MKKLIILAVIGLFGTSALAGISITDQKVHEWAEVIEYKKEGGFVTTQEWIQQMYEQASLLANKGIAKANSFCIKRYKTAQFNERTDFIGAQILSESKEMNKVDFKILVTQKFRCWFPRD